MAAFRRCMVTCGRRHLSLEHFGEFCRILSASLRLAESEDALRHATVLLFLVVLLVGVVDVDAVALEVLTIHELSRPVRALEVVERDEAVVARFTCLNIALDLGGEDDAELAEDFPQQAFVDLVRQIADEDFGPDLLRPLVLTRLIDFDRFVEQFDHVEDFDRVVRVLLCFEFDKAVALVLVCDLVARYVHVDDWSGL